MKNNSDDEDNSGGFFTIDEPDLPSQPAQLSHIETTAVYSQPTNAHYNLAGLSEEAIQARMEMQDDVHMELGEEAVIKKIMKLLKHSFITVLFHFYF